MTNTKRRYALTTRLCAALLCLVTGTGCAPTLTGHKEDSVADVLPKQHANQKAENVSQASDARTDWRKFFADSNLQALIDHALRNNQELQIMAQEIDIANTEVMGRRGEYYPKAGIGADTGIAVPGQYPRTSVGEDAPRQEAETESRFGELEFGVGFYATWEVDIWKKLRNATKSAAYSYLASIEGRNFAITSLVAEIASSYYELMALDNQLEVLRSNIAIQQDALAIIRIQKQAARVTELAVTRFEAEVLKNQSRLYDVAQDIVETENRINLLVGRYPQAVERSSQTFVDLAPQPVQSGVPTQLLENRPDVRQAEFELRSAELDIDVARAMFYPALTIDAGVGYRAGNVLHLFNTPDSLIAGVVGNLFTPLVNRNAIKANYYAANAKQIQAVYNYERIVLGAYVECANQLAMIANMEKSFDLRTQQGRATQHIDHDLDRTL